MKTIKHLILLLLLTLSNVSYADVPEEYPSGALYRIESISYEMLDDRISANIIFVNGYQFIYLPIDNEEKNLKYLESNFFPGKRIAIGSLPQTPQYIIETWDTDKINNLGEAFLYLIFSRKLEVSLSEQTLNLLPTIQKIEKVSTGWFSSELHVILSDDSQWKCTNSLSVQNIKTWKKGQRVMFGKDVSSLDKCKTLLINVEAGYKEPKSYSNKQTYYIDRRSAYVISTN